MGIEMFGMCGWRWFNEPASWSAGPPLTVQSEPETDWWRTTHYGFVHDNGHALLHGAEPGFRATATFEADYRDQYDQAGLLVRADERNWLKTGIELVDGALLLGAVVTRDTSDWSVTPCPARQSVSLDVRQEGDSITVRYGVDGQPPETLLRIAYFPPDLPVSVGPMCASPTGQGFPARFTEVALSGTA